MDYLEHSVKTLALQYQTMSYVIRALSGLIRSEILPTMALQTLQVRETVLRQVLSEGEEEMSQIMEEVKELRELSECRRRSSDHCKIWNSLTLPI